MAPGVMTTRSEQCPGCMGSDANSPRTDVDRPGSVDSPRRGGRARARALIAAASASSRARGSISQRRGRTKVLPVVEETRSRGQLQALAAARVAPVANQESQETVSRA